MASPAWFSSVLSMFNASGRYPSLFSMSDRDLARRGYDRAGLQRSFISGLSGF